MHHALQPFVADNITDRLGPAQTALALLQANGLAGARTACTVLEQAGLDDDDPDLQLAIIELLHLMIEEVASSGVTADLRAALSRISINHAALGYDLLLLSNFPDGTGELSELDDATILSLAGLACASGQPADAIALLDEAAAERGGPGFRRAAFAMRSHVLGQGYFWPAFADPASTLDEARLLVDRAPLGIDAHRALARRLTEAGQIGDAAAAFAVALALPIGDADKQGVADDIAMLAALAIALNEATKMEQHRVKLALAACPDILARAATALESSASADLRSITGEVAAAQAALWLNTFAEATPAARSPYPLVDGKPHVDTVWLEITNYCNQKCTFCPDMHREDARSWLPLAEVKRLIDELAATVSVGSMQLNAYGEPLLHPNVAEIIAYIREKQLPWPTFFTSHGLTLVEKKLKQLSHNYPAGIAISLHNDSQASYDATRSAKIGDYATLVSRVTDLLRQMADEKAACHVRLYQMVCNGAEDSEVDPRVRAAFPDSVERMAAHVRKWEVITAGIAELLGGNVKAIVNPPERIAQAFREASHGDGVHLPILSWFDGNAWQQVFISARPVGTYANLLLEYHPEWTVRRKIVSRRTCGFIATPSLAIFASGRLGICCLDLNSTATFGALSDHDSLVAALHSPAALRMFAQVSNGIALSKGCQICLGSGEQLCGSTPQPEVATAA